ncbi:hypothetical protein RB195_014406 [Necator americanus]|uniref:Amino acid permease n=1 Tax=Necator americanus TaxID=51031 RepID=A0ABR1DZY0_NECAM
MIGAESSHILKPTTPSLAFPVDSLTKSDSRDADGLLPPIWNGSVFIPPDCTLNSTCQYGLMNYFQIMEMESLWGPLITAGIFAATLSSALASLVSAPKVFQAVCKDRLFPKIGYFAKGYGKNEEPRRAYALTFIIAMAMIGIGDLNAIAPIISNFFLASYALINYACFDASFADSPGFRPGFKYYNIWATALITFFCFAALFLYILHRKPDVNWGSSTQAHSYKNALSGMIKLSHTEEHVKNYRPQLLVLCGNAAARPSLVDFANSITKGTSLMICGYVVPYNPSDRVYSVMRKLERQLSEWLRKRRVKAFYAAVANASLRAGAQSLLQVCGLGKLRPNIILIGFKTNWSRRGPIPETMEDMNEYFGTIQDAFDSNMAVCVLRNGDMGLDFSEAMKLLNVGESRRLQINLDENDKDGLESPCRPLTETKSNSKASQKNESEEERAETGSSNTLTENYGFVDMEDENCCDCNADHSEECEKCRPEAKDSEDVETGSSQPHLSDDPKEIKHTFSLRRRSTRRPTTEQKALLASISRFQRKVKKGVIDVWWLYDDGGLTLLIPHLLTIPKSYLEGAKLRVFTISTSSRTMEQEQRSMAALLSKFRINFSDVSVISDIGRKPQPETLMSWEKLILPFIAPDDSECPLGMTTQSELDAQKQKTNRQLRAAELLREHSADADLIVMTLPVPRKGMVSASLYLSCCAPSFHPIALSTSIVTFVLYIDAFEDEYHAP